MVIDPHMVTLMVCLVVFKAWAVELGQWQDLRTSFLNQRMMVSKVDLLIAVRVGTLSNNHGRRAP